MPRPSHPRVVAGFAVLSVVLLAFGLWLDDFFALAGAVVAAAGAAYVGTEPSR